MWPTFIFPGKRWNISGQRVILASSTSKLGSILNDHMIQDGDNNEFKTKAIRGGPRPCIFPGARAEHLSSALPSGGLDVKVTNDDDGHCESVIFFISTADYFHIAILSKDIVAQNLKVKVGAT